MVKKTVITILIFWIAGFTACTRQIYQAAYPTLNDGAYDTEFPYRNCSKELKRIGDTVKMVNSIAYYKSYIFVEANQLLHRNLTTENLQNDASGQIFFNNSTAGTATIIFHEGQQLALLTCAHVVSFPDTIISYFTLSNGKPSMFIQSVAVKERQSNYVTDLWKVPEVEVLITDKDNDIALLGGILPGSEIPMIPVFDYPFGSAKNLEWGSFVYLMGFPRGYKLITRGIVSDPNRTKNGEFIIDALFNRGCSGGLVLAVKDGVPNFEFVGIARSAAAEYEYVIRPASTFDQSKYDLTFPYNGDLFVDYKANINYGVTHIVPVEQIREFLSKNRTELRERGYDFSKFTGD
ncbi:MAG: trypsin-like peptidase domain-containing protein [Candidatus Marinimicrobia bacterium]|nr:trypsin-like peptidase domain-containing protein [Candidatus Neomarinimicrobiota bacterium]